MIAIDGSAGEGGGELSCVTPSRHNTTNIEAVERFLPISFTVEKIAADHFMMKVSA